MLAFNAEERLSIKEIRCHPWMKGRVATQHEVFIEMHARKSGDCSNSSINSSCSELPELFDISEIVQKNKLEEYKKNDDSDEFWGLCWFF